MKKGKKVKEIKSSGFSSPFVCQFLQQYLACFKDFSLLGLF
jgi:hypothetical protein